MALPTLVPLLGYLYCQDAASYPEASTSIPLDRRKKLTAEYPEKVRNWRI